jgi:threonine dehydrogenase-like Zn-dependent dehydrogenase
MSQLNATVRLVGKHPEKLAICEKWGVKHRLLNDVGLRGDQDIVVDCTGSDTGLPLALQLVRPRGTIVLKTTVAGTQTMGWAPFVIDELTLVGSRCGPFDRTLAALQRGEVDVRSLIAGRLPLDRGVEALDLAGRRLKVLLNVAAE